MKPLFLSLLFLFSTTCKESPTVYLCQSKGGKKYHFRSDCRGLSNCSHKVVETTLEKAKALGKTKCGWEK